MSSTHTTARDSSLQEWGKTLRRFPIGAEIDAVIEKHVSYGTLLTLEGGTRGFIDPIERPQKLGAAGDRVRVKVVGHREANRQIDVIPASLQAF